MTDTASVVDAPGTSPSRAKTDVIADTAASHNNMNTQPNTGMLFEIDVGEF